MALTRFSDLDNWDLVNDDQDIRGWPVKDTTGNTLGTIRDFMVDTDAERVNSLLLEDGREIPVEDVDPDFNQHTVLLHGATMGTATTGLAGTGRAPLTGTAAGTAREGAGTTGRLEGEKAIPIVEEEVKVGKRPVEKGWARIRSRVVSKPVHEEVNLREEHVDVERQRVNRPATEADFQERTIEAREMAEEPVVKKEARVVGEVGLRKEATQHTEAVNDTARRTEVNVENPRETDRGTGTRAFNDYDTDFRRDYQMRYASRGGNYDEYQPAYRYGYDLANDPRYQGRDWNTIEPEVRRDWESRYGGTGSTWDRFKDSIRYGWDKVTNRV